MILVEARNMGEDQHSRSVRHMVELAQHMICFVEKDCERRGPQDPLESVFASLLRVFLLQLEFLI